VLCFCWWEDLQIYFYQKIKQMWTLFVISFSLLLSYEQGELCPGVGRYSRLFFFVQWMQREMKRFICTWVTKRAFELSYVHSWIVFCALFVELKDSTTVTAYRTSIFNENSTRKGLKTSGATFFWRYLYSECNVLWVIHSQGEGFGKSKLGLLRAIFVYNK
jgi:hypothetical protein